MKVVHPAPTSMIARCTSLPTPACLPVGHTGPGVRQVHLAGITDQEFDLEFVRGMKSRGYRLSADMQSFVRQVDPATRRISFGDVADKAAIVRHFWTWSSSMSSKPGS
jgi:hypothetical protein